MDEENKESVLLQTVFAAAVREAHQSELDALPSEEALARELSFSPEFERSMAALTKKASRAARGRRISRYAGRAAVILLTIFSVSSAAFLAAPEVRASMRHIVMSWFDTHASFDFHPEEAAGDVIWKPGYLPEGFSLKEDQSLDFMQLLDYENADGLRITIQCMPADGTSISLDNEHSTHIIIELDSGEGHLFEGIEGYPTMLLWEKRGTSFLIISYLKDNSEILRVAENMTPLQSGE